MERTVVKVTSRRQQQEETYRYWRSRPDWERMSAVADLIRSAYLMKGIDLDAARPDRPSPRIQRIRR